MNTSSKNSLAQESKKSKEVKLFVKQTVNNCEVSLTADEFFELKMKELMFKIYFAVKYPCSELKHGLNKTMFELSDFRSTILKSDVKQINDAFQDINLGIEICEPLFSEKRSARTGGYYSSLDSCTIVMYDYVIDEFENFIEIKEYEEKRNNRCAIAAQIFRKDKDI